MDYLQALNFALNGQAVLFTGAGFSADSVSIDGFSPPQGTELAHILCAQSCTNLIDDLKDAADVAVPRLTSDVAIPMLQEMYRIQSVQNEHKIIANIPWVRMYTTNYDDTLEVACSQSGKSYVAITSMDSTKKPRNVNIIQHINGYINALDKQTIFNEFKLTNQSYQTVDFLDSEWYNILIGDLQTASSCFFVGYTLYDIDIQRILRKINNIKDKCFFIFKDYPGDALAARVSGFGSVVTGGCAKFSEDIMHAKSAFVPIHHNFNFRCFNKETKDKYCGNDSLRPDVFDLLTFGKVNNFKLYNSIANNFDNEYCVVMAYFYKILDAIKRRVHNIVIDSDIGNGKTILIEMLKAYYVLNDVDVFSFVHSSDDIRKEFSEIYKNSKMQIIFIEGIHRNTAVIESSKFQRPDNTFFIITERTALAEISGRHIERWFDSDVCSVSINKIYDDDLKILIKLLRSNGLLGDFSRYSDEKCL